MGLAQPSSLETRVTYTPTSHPGERILPRLIIWNLGLFLIQETSVFQVPIPTKFLEKLTERTQIHEPMSDLFFLLCFVLCGGLWRKQLKNLCFLKETTRVS